MTNSEQTSVLISGGNKGLGFEAARRLGKQGWPILLGSRDESRGRAAADKLTDGGANVVVVPLDVTSDESVTDAVRLVREHRPAGCADQQRRRARKGYYACRRDGWRNSFRLPHQRVRTDQGHVCVPSLLQAADHPRVVMVSSSGGSFTVVTDPGQPFSRIHELAYSSSKAALNMITVRYAQALPKIKFNIATPGEIANRKFAATDMNNHTGCSWQASLSLTHRCPPSI